MLIYASEVFEFSKGDHVGFKPTVSLYAEGHRTGTVTAIGRRLVHVRSEQSGEIFHVAPDRLVVQDAVT